MVPVFVKRITRRKSIKVCILSVDKVKIIKKKYINDGFQGGSAASGLRGRAYMGSVAENLEFSTVRT